MKNTIKIIQNQLQGALYEIASLSTQITYQKENIEPNFSKMAQWEVKEFQYSNDATLIEFNQLRRHIICNEAIFNPMLSKFNLSVTTFLASL